MKKLFYGLVSIISFFISITSYSATITTSGSGNWSSTTPDAPWPSGTVPSATDDVIIDNTHNVSVDVATSINSVTINSGGTLTIITNNLSVSTTVSVSGTLSRSGTGTVGGTITFNSGGVYDHAQEWWYHNHSRMEFRLHLFDFRYSV
ncbi:MAG: hypothetical protein MZU79_02240 [Anaerotruncus sp.]|nr:hypothetical protein [Anaerotruncus sp.]